MLVGQLTKAATRSTFHPNLGAWLELFATLSGRLPADDHVWIATEDVPAFVRFEGPLDPAGPVWRSSSRAPAGLISKTGHSRLSRAAADSVRYRTDVADRRCQYRQMIA